MSSHSLPPPLAPDGFKSVKAKNKSTLRDYAVYAVILVILLGLIGGSAYYFTRPKSEQEQLRSKLDRTRDEMLLRDGKDKAEPERLPELKAPKNLDGLLDDSVAAPKTTPPIANTAVPKTGNVSTYAGGRANGVLLSDDPGLPKASPEFIHFAETLKVSGVLQGPPAKAMMNGRMFRAGAIIDPELGVTFVSVEGSKLLLRDKNGAELRLTY